VGVVSLFQEVYPLLGPAPGGASPKFVTISSSLASIELIGAEPVKGLTPYGMSKAALNFFTRTIHDENPELIAFPIHPGYVDLPLSQHVKMIC
jgi:norsolorinic acid ketoreductase